MDGTLVLLAIACALAVVAARRGQLREGVAMSVQRFLEILPRLALALLAAGFIGRLIPSKPIAHLIGPDSGLPGILLAAVVGGFIPSGPIVSFPVVVVFAQAGAGFPQTVAFITAWSVFAFHRVLIYEVTLMGWRFSAIRLTASAILPLVCALTAEGLQAIYPIKWPPF
jgi:uncharacterized membrane protein YraQ (UPF0718 family)